MVSSDPISDMLTRIRNAIAVNKHVVRMPHSNMKESVAKNLQSAGFLHQVKVDSNESFKELVVTINGEGSNPTITEIKRLSKPGRRMYAKTADIPKVKNGRGIVLVSTSQGVMTGNEAVKKKVGGELICSVY